MALEAPISFRPDSEDRKLINTLAADGMTATEVVKRGLELMRAARVPARIPLYARSIDDQDVEQAIEAAITAACDCLDDLFTGTGSPEKRGVSSNFQGLLGDHIRAMLCGQEHANKSHSTMLNPLLARWDSFGRHLYAKQPEQGITIMQPAQRVNQPDLFFSDQGMVPITALEPGELFTSSEAAVKGYLAYLARRDESPQEHPARLVIVDYSKDELVALES